MITSTAISTNHPRRRLLKRDLSPLRRACVSLGLRVDAKPKTNLSWLLRKAGLGQTAIEYLRWSEDGQARKICVLYDSLSGSTERKAVTIDYLLMAAEADVHYISGVIQEEVSRVQGIEASLMAHTNAIQSLRKSIERAQTPNGHQDRHLMLRLAGMLPTAPRG